MLKLVLLSVLAVNSSMFCFNLAANPPTPLSNSVITPMIVESTLFGERSWDIYSRMLKERIVFLHSPINVDVARSTNAQLLFLNSDNPDEDITLYINSPGGEVYAGLAIYDTMHYIKADVCTIGMGVCASMAAALLASGEDGKRFALPHTRIMIHQPLGGARGQATDIEIQANEILHHKAKLNEILAKHTGQNLEQVREDTDRDNYMSAEEAVDYGLIDAIMESKPEP